MEAGMAEGTRRKKTQRKTAEKAGARRKKGAAQRKKRPPAPPRRRSPAASGERSLIARVADLAAGLAADLTAGAFRLAAGAGAVPLQVLLGEPANPKMAREAGAYLRELRELAGLTRKELSDALQLRDQSLLKAVENGTATLSVELILRLASILARHDPVPFITRFTRTYSPELWRVLEDWGVGRLPLHFEREREFINVYRRHDAARKLSDEGFAKVLDFTRAAFEASLHFVAESEKVEDEEAEPPGAG
jgi:transcriptional regulator with XRE-family HTH domain